MTTPTRERLLGLARSYEEVSPVTREAAVNYDDMSSLLSELHKEKEMLQGQQNHLSEGIARLEHCLKKDVDEDRVRMHRGRGARVLHGGVFLRRSLNNFGGEYWEIEAGKHVP